MVENTRENLIVEHFNLGLQHAEISAILAIKYDIVLSERQLKRILRRLGLRRRTTYSLISDVENFILNEISTSSQLHGYRWLHLKCLQTGLVVKQETVRLLLKEHDPVGVDFRTRKRLRRRQYYNNGPNYLWHLDGYDKLKPFGICVHGCIDGFSRHIMWLEAGTTNNDPKVIAGYFIKTIELIKGAPLRIRSDFGTENRSIEQMHIFLRNKEDDESQNVWLYGTSKCNQRIESWWSICRKHIAQFWMNLFQSLKNTNQFSGTFLDKSLIQFCFLRIIKDELAAVVLEWNTHRISKSRNSISPSGRPIMMYHTPQIYNTKDFLQSVACDKLAACKEECTFESLPCDEDVFHLCKVIIEEKGLAESKDPFHAVDLYISLRNEILSLVM